jgi:hypothetical protein
MPCSRYDHFPFAPPLRPRLGGSISSQPHRRNPEREPRNEKHETPAGLTGLSPKSLNFGFRDEEEQVGLSPKPAVGTASCLILLLKIFEQEHAEGANGRDFQAAHWPGLHIQNQPFKIQNCLLLLRSLLKIPSLTPIPIFKILRNSHLINF